MIQISKIKIGFVVLVVIVLVVIGYAERVRISDWWQEVTRPTLPSAASFEEVKEQAATFLEPDAKPEPKSTPTLTSEPPSSPSSEPEPVPTPVLPPERQTLPTSFNLAVPFTPQAPFANWDEVHEEACEEASVYMTHLYYQGVAEGLVTPATAEDELLRMVEAEKKMFGYFEDTTANETAQFAKAFYGYTNVDVLVDPTVEDIKRHVAAGHPVIVPAAGRLLGNPYFTPPGPVYHMLVIRGYTADQFIVNDPGTRRGEAYVYDIDTIMDAMHDWNVEDMTLGKKTVIVIYPN